MQEPAQRVRKLFHEAAGFELMVVKEFMQEHEMSAEIETINAARLIVKLCDEKVALERDVADLKERNEQLYEKGHDLIDERNTLRAELGAARSEIDGLKANSKLTEDWDVLNLRVEQAERERNEFQGALLRVKFALGWSPEDVEMNEGVIRNMVGRARYYLAEKNDLAFKLGQIEEIINGSDS